MDLLSNLRRSSIVLNRFYVKSLSQSDLTAYEYRCIFKKTPELGDEKRLLASICYKLGAIAVRIGSNIITKEAVRPEKLQGHDWQLVQMGTKQLDCRNDAHRCALETFERKFLERDLSASSQTEVRKAAEGGLIWWVVGAKGIEKSGNGWEVHRGRRIDVSLDAEGNLYLEIDIHHRFYTPWTVHQWLEQYPEIPLSYVRNNYLDERHGFINWQYGRFTQERPQDILLDCLGMSLAEYHLNKGATEEEVQQSYVVYVKPISWRKGKLTAHLSRRLSPSLTMEMLAKVAEDSTVCDREKREIRAVFKSIKQSINQRLQEAQKTASWILTKTYGISSPAIALSCDGYLLPAAKLLAANQQPVSKTADIRNKGCAKIGETSFGYLNLYNNQLQYPLEVHKCLLEIANKNNLQLSLDQRRVLSDYPQDDLDQQMFWQTWSSQGIKTVLVVMPWDSHHDKQKIRIQAIQAGIATQFMVPLPKADKYKALNVTLGLLCKAGWQPIQLESVDHPEVADLIIGFDTGTNRELYYGTSAFAVLADGQNLGWELPDVQRGETFSGQAIWQTVSKLIIKFYQICQRYPQKLLLMRDGLVQEGEFQQTIELLKERKIAVDVISVRKSGAGRMGQEIYENGQLVYRDAAIGSVILQPAERSFIMVTSQPVSKTIGSIRPLRIVHEYGSTDLELLALQTYHLTQLHPASGFRSCRLPWVLHLADRSSKEFQRIGQVSVLQNISRDKLIAV
ncbi:argonaute PAZ domain-containing protein [Synechococcus elongatus]|uniref:argonaute PAZ domain-containing protein n=1 Tax=Synechococcus elongatus TaxID=32046 RepID=UPI000F7ECE91|nr:argonaute PAZ domain-containing protein [Synechococcus elongatus]